MCPICKSSRYLNPDMRFLVNPECYHKICESCVDRIFSVGPAQCPYAGCEKILRKNKFKTQVFEDLGVEREVDIRARVSRTFNKRQQDFDSLDDYNDYLEEVENIIFNLVNGVDVEATESKLQAYEQANRNIILANSLRQKQEDEQMEELQSLETQRRRKAQLLALQAEEDERRIKEQTEKELVRQLATGEGDAAAIMKNVSNMALKRSSARRRQLEEELRQPLSIPLRLRGARSATPGNATPFTPFNGDRQQEYLFTVNDEYFDPLMNDVANNPQYRASGFSVKGSFRQALVSAFFGIGCDVQHEKAAPLAV
ncbi:TFIIH/NER complex subunit TFB3 [Sugiyamaella lignohabitans]|uniref:RNA polymerase II transcription factor B subunit 3 n=1 Tax=Sugiyamaella lignohabitans TaxID=796027 RepID=A0A167EAS1_9ASCO|nr:TFIIH/NER complex subunit TFB3 [Sugiyamaella lignohabitans]ANB13846.1 TFIIH/NER complex subunit TFB3 [Sugiyamaella lignohabitans]